MSDLEENLSAAQKQMKNPVIQSKIQKLIGAGIVQMKYNPQRQPLKLRSSKQITDFTLGGQDIRKPYLNMREPFAAPCKLFFAHHLCFALSTSMSFCNPARFSERL
ncbi:hypothetical protein F2Q69_00063488 [Brassica cretica]|nr:hypothetical protein F2Q69_00063488 [Brassica cretica]